MSGPFARVETERLLLEACDPRAHLDDLHPIFADPRTWEHAPASRHASPEVTASWLELAAARWREDGLGCWAVRQAASGEVVGAGGCWRHVTADWNLFYRFAPAAWGGGYATEVGRAAIDAARAVDPDAAVVAWIRYHNAASICVAERLGLQAQPPQLDPSDGVERVPYADRPLS